MKLLTNYMMNVQQVDRVGVTISVIRDNLGDTFTAISELIPHIHELDMEDIEKVLECLCMGTKYQETESIQLLLDSISPTDRGLPESCKVHVRNHVSAYWICQGPRVNEAVMNLMSTIGEPGVIYQKTENRDGEAPLNLMRSVARNWAISKRYLPQIVAMYIISDADIQTFVGECPDCAWVYDLFNFKQDALAGMTMRIQL